MEKTETLLGVWMAGGIDTDGRERGREVGGQGGVVGGDVVEVVVEASGRQTEFGNQ